MESDVNPPFRHDPDHGLVVEAEQVPSPNQDNRPDGVTIDTIVIHAICLPPQTYGNHYVEDFFQNRLDPNIHPYFQDIANRRVSSHFFVKRTGSLIQFVSTLQRAWHAGESEFQGRARVNDFSIGIELEGCDAHEFESPQYDTLTALITCLRTAYPAISKDRLTGHCDVSPGRKTDPGPNFDWELVLASQD